MHSAEHILNQTMDRMFNCGRCFNAHIERKKSKCDYRFNRPLSQMELQEIQTRVNRIFAEDLPVIEKYIPRSEALRNYNTEKLPAMPATPSESFKSGTMMPAPVSGRMSNLRVKSQDFRSLPPVLMKVS